VSEGVIDRLKGEKGKEKYRRCSVTERIGTDKERVRRETDRRQGTERWWRDGGATARSRKEIERGQRNAGKRGKDEGRKCGKLR